MGRRPFGQQFASLALGYGLALVLILVFVAVRLGLRPRPVIETRGALGVSDAGSIVQAGVGEVEMTGTMTNGFGRAASVHHPDGGGAVLRDQLIAHLRVHEGHRQRKSLAVGKLVAALGTAASA